MTDSDFSCPAAGVCKAAVSEGMSRAITERTSSRAVVRARSTVKVCGPWRTPPTTNARPRTSRTLDRIEPTIVPWTTS